MENITFEDFKKLLLNYDKFTKEDLNNLYEKYGEKHVKDLFERVTNNLTEEQFILFAKKFAIYFESYNTSCYENFELDKTGPVGFLLNSVGGVNTSLMSANEEKYYGSFLKEGKENLTIINEMDDETLYPSLNINKIILSIANATDYEKAISLLKEIKSLPYKLCDETIFKNENKFLKLYLKLFSTSRPNEKELSVFLKDLDKNDILTDDRLFYELKLLKNYVISKCNFFKRNIRLSVVVSKRYNGKILSFEDFLQDGNIGLIKAINKYEVDKGYRFSTYAMWWIRSIIVRNMANFDETIRKPAHIVEIHNRYVKFASDYLATYGIEPTVKEAAGALGEQISTIKEVIKNFSSLTSLENNLNNTEEEDFTLKSVIADDGPLPDELYFDKEFMEVFDKATKELLDERTADMLKKHFGLTEDGKKYTLEEVGQMYNVTRERVRQIENKALRKLYYNDHQYGLKLYLGK